MKRHPFFAMHDRGGDLYHHDAAERLDRIKRADIEGLRLILNGDLLLQNSVQQAAERRLKKLESACTS